MFRYPSNTVPSVLYLPPLPRHPLQVTVSPASSSIALGQTQQFTATGNYSDDTTVNLTNLILWKSSDATKAYIDPSGLATGLTITAPTSVTITAQEPLSGKTGTAALTVTAVTALLVTPSAATMAAGAK